MLLVCALALGACGTDTQRPTDRVTEGDRLLAKGDTLGAQAAYRLALGQDSLDAGILARMGRLYAAQGKAQPADTYLRRAADLTYRRGVAALQNGDQAGARAAFEQTVAIIPAHPLGWIRLGDLALAGGHEAEALSLYEKAVAANPEYPEAYVKTGKLYLKQQRLTDAQRAFERSIDLNINSLEAYLGLGELYVQQGNPTAAAAQYRNVLLIDPKSAVAQAALARLGSPP